MPRDAQVSIASIAHYVVAHEPEPVQRVKALHDWVADHIAYDVAMLQSGHIHSQDAETVFQRRVAVCAGYARLLAALGDAANIPIQYIVGDAHAQEGSSTGLSGGVPHAWNVVQIAGAWYLMDATWDAGGVNGSAFNKHYSTDYLFTPGSYFNYSHFPDEEGWQLAARPVARGEFMRRPGLRPSFFRLGISLAQAERSQQTVADTARIEMRVPLGVLVVGNWRNAQTNAEGDCTNFGSRNAAVSCALASRGRYEVTLFGALETETTLPTIATFEFLAEPR